MLRIVAGVHGSRRIEVPPGSSTRPTSDRVREAIFSMLGGIDRAVVLDLFAGSGALGLEALSRGAARSVFVDSSKSAISCIDRNVELLAVGSSAQVIAGDWKRSLGSLAERDERFDLVFVDPPYSDAPRVAEELVESLGPVLAPGATIVFESGPGCPLVEGLPVRREKRYGDTVVRLHVRD